MFVDIETSSSLILLSYVGIESATLNLSLSLTEIKMLRNIEKELFEYLEAGHFEVHNSIMLSQEGAIRARPVSHKARQCQYV